jgi:hypothetical protein
MAEARAEETRAAARLRHLAKARRVRTNNIAKAKRRAEREAAGEATRLERQERELDARYEKALEKARSYEGLAVSEGERKAWDKVHQIGGQLRSVIAARRGLERGR